MWHSEFPTDSSFEGGLEEIWKIEYLPHIYPNFFVPPLEEKPQNPIMETLKLAAANSSLPPRLVHINKELDVISQELIFDYKPKSSSTWWTDALASNTCLTNQIQSWDKLRSPRSPNASSGPFLSEQGSLLFAYARYHIEPPLTEPGITVVYIPQEDLLMSLRKTVLGLSSTLHIWNEPMERFVQVVTGDRKKGLLLIDGRDKVISNSIITRFLTIGTLLRRLETLLDNLRKKNWTSDRPTIHAFAHSLSTIMAYLRDGLQHNPIPLDSNNGGNVLSTFWRYYGQYEDILVALSDLYGRNEDKSPVDYLPLDSAPVPLLSRIYNHLNTHLERRSPRIICALFAFLLTNTSREYFQQVGYSVGFGGQLTPRQSRIRAESLDQYGFGEDPTVEEEEGLEAFKLDKVEDVLPDFFPPELLDVLPAAQKSLILLRVAQPDHPLLASNLQHREVKWVWTSPEIEAEWVCDATVPQAPIPNTPIYNNTQQPPLSNKYESEISQFNLFDLEPGTAIDQRLLETTPTRLLQSFLDSFPEYLPPITPTLDHLTSVVFSKLHRHASTLSSALLSIFVSPSIGNLNFQAHLILLRSYLLLTDPIFKSGLLVALFSDSDEPEMTNQAYNMSLRTMRRKTSKIKQEQTQPWAVGLNQGLLERETWPPKDSDFSFFLRTVIVDSFGKGRENTKDGEPDQITKEAGWRLGFAIRDLPMGPGRDKWLNPLAIEALDSLYMDYRPPNPLNVLISPEIMSKYQRVFAFILRLMRVESAIKTLYRMIRFSAKPLFSTLASSRKLLLHFRFVAQVFVSNLSGYVFDTAIRGNFDVFISRLKPGATSSPAGEKLGFSDVFELADCHSTLLDDILSACLLRSGQRAVGDLLRHVLEHILEFTIIVGELHRNRLEEYQAAPMLEDVYKKFREKTKTFVKVLRGLVDKNSSTLKWQIEVRSEDDRKPTGGIDALYHLLLRLDPNDWWAESK